METLTFLQDCLGTIYISTHNPEKIITNYSYLLQEKKKLLDRLHNTLMMDEEHEIIIEDWQLDLLQLQSDTIIYDSNNNVLEYPQYYSHEELMLISLLKRIAQNEIAITEQEYLILIKFFKNRKLVEDIIKNSVNGLKVNKKTLAKIITLFEKQTSPVGHNIKTYESLCKKLILEKETVQTLKKIA